jgi:hypothetical protein
MGPRGPFRYEIARENGSNRDLSQGHYHRDPVFFLLIGLLCESYFPLDLIEDYFLRVFAGVAFGGVTWVTAPAPRPSYQFDRGSDGGH